MCVCVCGGGGGGGGGFTSYCNEEGTICNIKNERIVSVLHDIHVSQF